MSQPQPARAGKSWNDQTVAIPRDADGNTPTPEPGVQMRNFGTSDGQADRRPTTVDEHGRVSSGDPQ